jgi:uncharacterized DUF497 family protein
MNFTWDEAKRLSNLRKHGYDFADASKVFAGTTLTFEDDRFDYGEDRYITIGWLQDMIVVIAYTERSNVTRIISMRGAQTHEQRLFFQYIAD